MVRNNGGALVVVRLPEGAMNEEKTAERHVRHKWKKREADLKEVRGQI